MSDPVLDPNAALRLPNIRRFLIFRLLFNGRFYYPVFTVLFLDYGLTLTQFSILNAVWAVTIVLSEVPSGALADRLGRKRLLVFAAGAMIIEMMLIGFLPTGNAELVFWVFLLNRILSGLAEAAASGADEALAYDTLVQRGMEGSWGRVLESAMRLQSVAFIFALGLGAIVFDHELLNRAGSLIGLELGITRELSMRFPILLTLLTAVGAFFTVLGMNEKESTWDVSGTPWRDTLAAAKWVLASGPILILMAYGVLFDSFNRQFATLASEYYRTIEYPEWSFGLIGAGSAGLGLVLPRLARLMSERMEPRQVAAVVGTVSLIGFLGIGLAIPLWGVLFSFLAFSSMSMTGFFLSTYLHRVTESRQRATILSFRGLSVNLAYGLISMSYASLANSLAGGGDSGSERGESGAVFVETLQWFAPTFIVGFVLVTLFTKLRLGHLSPEFKKSETPA